MFKTMNKRIKNEKGLTLIELLAVIVILAIVAAIAIPAVGNIIDNSRYKAAKSDAIMILDAANLYFADNPSKLNVDLPTLVSSGYIDNSGTFDKTATTNKVTKDTAGNYLDGVATFGNKTATFQKTTLKNITDDEQSPKSPTVTAVANGKIFIQKTS